MSQEVIEIGKMIIEACWVKLEINLTPYQRSRPDDIPPEAAHSSESKWSGWMRFLPMRIISEYVPLTSTCCEENFYVELWWKLYQVVAVFTNALRVRHQVRIRQHRIDLLVQTESLISVYNVEELDCGAYICLDSANT